MYYQLLQGIKLTIKNKFKMFCIKIGTWCFKNFAKDVKKEVDIYMVPFKKELYSLKVLLNACTLEYFLAKDYKDFHILDTPECMFLCDSKNFCMPLYSDHIIDILIGLYQLPIEASKENRIINVDTLGINIINRVIDDYCNKL